MSNSVHPCPFCGAWTAALADQEEAGDLIYLTFSCDCGLSFVEVFEYLHTEDEDGNEVTE